MDGHFVPNITFGPLVVEAVKKCATVPLDVHLMISNPEKYVAAFCKAGADILTVHAEACADLPAVLDSIRQGGALVGVTVNPDIGIDLILPHLAKIDQVLIMTVFAGFSGQSFIPQALPKVKAVYDEARRIGRALDIEVDGGINESTARACAAQGANVFVAGSYVYGGANYGERIAAVRAGAVAGAGELQS
jgi:ribulose-phosphate 3-epimerase